MNVLRRVSIPIVGSVDTTVGGFMNRILYFEDTHGRSPKVHLLRCSVQRYVHMERHP